MNFWSDFFFLQWLHVSLTLNQTHTQESEHTLIHFLASRTRTIGRAREGCEKRRGILLRLIYQRLGEVLSGHSSLADSGPGLGPLGDRQTPPRSWGSRKKKKKYHTQTAKHTHSHVPTFAFTLLSSTFLSRICHPQVPGGAPVNACIPLVCFLFSFWFGICRLAPWARPCCVPVSDKGIP